MEGEGVKTKERKKYTKQGGIIAFRRLKNGSTCAKTDTLATY